MTKQAFIDKLTESGVEFRLDDTDHDTYLITANLLSETWYVEFEDEDLIEIDIHRRVDIGSDIPPKPEILMLAFGRVARAWQTAATELGIDFVSPYTVDLPDSDDSDNCLPYETTGFLPQFGQDGTVIFSTDNTLLDYSMPKTIGRQDIPGCPGPNFSILTHHYDHYDRDTFVKALVEWGWHGKDDPPEWYEAACKRFHPDAR